MMGSTRFRNVEVAVPQLLWALHCGTWCDEHFALNLHTSDLAGAGEEDTTPHINLLVIVEREVGDIEFSSLAS